MDVQGNLDQKQSWGTFFRGAIRGKTRILLAWIFGIALVLSARHFPSWPGVVVCFLGATLRFWASGYLRKDSRPAVGGPYAFVRNPLYVGTFLMAIGTALAVENYVLFGVSSALFAVIYHFIVLDEEEKLQRIFGEPYSHYCALVPRFIPRLIPLKAEQLDLVNPDRTHRRYSFAITMKNRAYEAYAAFAALIGFVWLVAAVWQRLL
ncbi:isoprenylcysteine carboxylmethyltransferase family protein [Bdellovibrionota bacterium FG-2]